MSDPKAAFTEMCYKFHDFQEAMQLLEWDQQVMMSHKGADQRGNQLAVLAGLLHGMFTDPRLGETIAALEGRTDLDPYLSRNVWEARRVYDRQIRIPTALVVERAKACSTSQSAWEDARPRNDFAAFAPHLERVLKVTREIASVLNPESPYDGLIEDYEPGMTEAELAELFPALKTRLRKLLDKIQGAPCPPDRSILQRTYPAAAQEVFCRQILADMGYDMEAGRLDVSAHPFTNGTLRDVRITTRYQENWLPSALFGAMHEGGHAIYEQGLDPARYRDIAGCACSLGIHESQSRFWENVVGRSRPFWDHYFPSLQRTFPGVLDDVTVDTFYRAVNSVQPSLIRVEADEVTYNLHIVLRFELERALLHGQLEVADLPSVWNEKMRENLDIVPPDDADGVMQDIHWSAGLIGYFPTYTLGNLYGAQFSEAMRRDIPDLDDRIARGELLPAKDWLNEKIHRHGRHFDAGKLCEMITGKPLSEEPAMAYLEAKVAEVYGL
jgi:carboxypeptidase Taq